MELGHCKIQLRDPLGRALVASADVGRLSAYLDAVAGPGIIL